ncbi:MAG: RidA family protein [Epsilonproteobacteria bacterium]|nr:RidA family protein [Campylobacterota bacterium]
MNQNITQPISQGLYKPAVRYENIIYTSGMTPRKDGELLYSGKIKATEPIEVYKKAVCLASKNALLSALACLKEDEKISLVLQLTVYLCATEDFVQHSKIADYASNFLLEKLGVESIGSRATIGVFSLPSNAPVEVVFVAIVGKC